jgi:hypothetical protein
MFRSGILAAVLCLPAVAMAQSALPPGTILPVSLDRALVAAKATPGMQIRAKIMQNIPGSSVRRGATVLGRIIRTSSLKSGQTRLELSFDAVRAHGQTIPLTADIRALASFFDVEQAKMPEVMSSRGFTPENSPTRQIGGEQVYRGGGPVAIDMKTVGRPTPYGILGPPRTLPGQRCRGEVGDHHTLQAWWLFSTDACGVYGYNNIHIEHAGRTAPEGTIVLDAEKGKLKLDSGSALLLRVVSDGKDGTMQAAVRP